jgi:N utilization substance protein B
MTEKSRFKSFEELTAKAHKSTEKNIKPRRGSRYERHRVSRLMAVQATYEANHNQLPYQRVAKSFLEFRFKNHDHPVVPDRDLFIHLINSLETRKDQIDDILEQIVVGTWTLDALDAVLKSILMMGIAELLEPYKDAPKPLVISEYVEVAKGFFDDKEAGYINKALDSVLKKLS